MLKHEFVDAISDEIYTCPPLRGSSGALLQSGMVGLKNSGMVV